MLLLDSYHDRHASNDEPVAEDLLTSARVLDVDANRRRVGHIAEATLVRRDLLVDDAEAFLARGLSDVDVEVPKGVK